jgi:formamidopyrimidine-DNA glycosylase
MPELPEVETIVRGLNHGVKGLTVAKVSYVAQHLLKREPRLRKLAGEAFGGFERRGKYIIANLKSGRRLMIHLRMTGRILIGDDVRRQDKHDHLELMFAGDRRRLVFRDVRKFGVVRFVDSDKPCELDGLGIEAPEITAVTLAELVLRRRRPIKSLLLDQQVIAGLGNIYVDESLYRSGIHPLKPAESLRPEQIKTLARVIRQVLRLAIKHLGTTFDSYSGVNGESGRFARYLKVYQQKGCRCGRCGDTIRRITVGGRGTHFCPNCQKAPTHLKR